ncbi:WxL domain-containing protein [Weissella diestrammenae]|uniref:WxL domain-containing protein n=1 Tax=Weissella diestrammenae TaxID=1162633 RepID=A0A7G9T433_9LACO|nr:WxL domain-containing protein [Weissella diestrammenae]MCM0583380.1 WxL domain-containing protein [Weissella diestrammenae]QNN74858.1 WxL domain-containing protein [Weissella diestrammenae]
MKTKAFAAISLATLLSPAILAFGQASADAIKPVDSTADFSVIAKDPTDPTDPSGSLVLKSVPSFSFGEVKSSEIFSGFANKAATNDSTLEIDDNRLGTSDWSLTATMGAFSDGSSTTLSSDSALKFTTTGTLGETVDANIKGDGSSASIATGNAKHGNDVFAIKGTDTKLDMGANASAVLTKGQQFTSTINWNLSSTQPVASAAN